jgi:hypothetical protein
MCLLYSVVLVSTNPLSTLDPYNPQLNPAWANAIAFHPLTIAVVFIIAAGAAWAEHRLENAPEFPLGLLVGETAVLATILLNCLVLLWGGQEDWHTLALLLFVAHLPIAAVEGIVLGFAVGFLARVKPEMIGWRGSPMDIGSPAPPVVTSLNGHIRAAESPRPLPEKTK